MFNIRQVYGFIHYVLYDCKASTFVWQRVSSIMTFKIPYKDIVFCKYMTRMQEVPLKPEISRFLIFTTRHIRTTNKELFKQSKLLYYILSTLEISSTLCKGFYPYIYKCITRIVNNCTNRKLICSVLNSKTNV